MRSQIIAALGAASLVTMVGFLVPTLAASRQYAAVDATRLDAADSPANAGQWSSYGRDYSEQRFSPLKQIDVGNVGRLGLAWYADLVERGGSYETTPIEVGGVIYVTAPWSKVYAFDASTGKQLWKYDPKVPGAWAVKLCCGIVNRGVAVWKNKVIWGTLDGRLIAVDAKTGKKIWQVQTTDPKQPRSITGVPRVADGRVFIGEAGSEFEQRGYLSAYDASTGRELWRWWAVPGDPAKGFEQPELEWAAKTWRGEWWEKGGGGTPWDAITYDPVTGLVYLGTGNGAPWPAWIRSPGGGDNLFTSSIVALDAKTGKFKWYYQETPQDGFDFDSTQQIITANIVIDGKKRHVVMHAPKNGIFYVFDATTGKLLEAKPFVPTVNWMSGFDANGRPILNPEANYGKTGNGFYVVPSMGGAHSWHPMAYNPDTGLVYIPTNYGSYPLVAETGAKMGNELLSINVAKCPSIPQPKLVGAGSYLLAWDPVHMKAVWTQRQGSGRAGVMTTAGDLVFQGTAQHGFSAYRADTGQQIWTTDTQAGIAGAPVSYRVHGEQYVAVVAGSGGFRRNYWAPTYARLLVYDLGGRVTLPKPAPYTPPVLNPPPNFGSKALLALGESQYDSHCASCHGDNDRLSTIFPDLRYAGELWSSGAFQAVVLGGALQSGGMVSFRKDLTPHDAAAIRAYVVRLANQAKNAPQRDGFAGFGRCARPPAVARGPASMLGAHAAATAPPAFRQ
ncbi:MAG TPA: PQQ-dependent dehydrogenase, methanol/ethanol family [Acidisoma sp.]|jgi:PQQ-dependent dehydrogenase (methanol/ethanol family)|nr:PQQ-dependent dehydrogenase, methanol/ethanol family [Acidisoma sp.]